MYFGLKSDPNATDRAVEIACRPSSMAAVLSIVLQHNTKKIETFLKQAKLKRKKRNNNTKER